MLARPRLWLRVDDRRGINLAVQHDGHSFADVFPVTRSKSAAAARIEAEGYAYAWFIWSKAGLASSTSSPVDTTSFRQLSFFPPPPGRCFPAWARPSRRPEAQPCRDRRRHRAQDEIQMRGSAQKSAPRGEDRTRRAAAPGCGCRPAS